MPSPPPQPVPTGTSRTRNASNNLAAPIPPRPGASPISYGGMAGISFTNGGGFSFEGRPRSFRWNAGNGSGQPGSFGARFYGDATDSPYQPFSTSITMGEPSSLMTSSMAFGLPASSLSSSYQRRSYAAAVAGAHNLSSSFASMSFQPMSFGTSYSKNQVHSLMQTRSDAELTKGYECCGETHEGLHALLEHVEDAHPFSDPDMPDSGFSPVTHAIDLDMEGVDGTIPPLNAKEAPSATASSRSSQSPIPVPNYPIPPSVSSKPTTPTEQPPSQLRISDVLTSPPEGDAPLTARTAMTSSSTSSPPDSLTTPTTSAQPSPVFTVPKINPARPGFLGSTAPRPPGAQKRFERAFNEVVATSPQNKSNVQAPTAVAPGVLFASAVAGLGIPTAPPVPGQKAEASKEGLEEEQADSAMPNGTKLTDPQLPQPSLFTTHKPWRCPNPGCNKAYKQSNGLKYHQQKGQCDFAIHDAVDLGLSIEEAEERSRPFVCAVGAGCNKRYRQMNGLKYHYLNSGEHGQYGLRMLQNGTHPHPPSLPQPQKRTTSVSTPTATVPTASAQRATAAAPYAVPSKMAAGPGIARPNPIGQGPRMGTWPAKPPPPKQAPPVQLPIQKGRDAVLFAAVGNDPLDVNGRLEI